MQPITILLVEDNESLRRVYKTHLEVAGFSVMEAENAHKAQVALEENPISLLLLDIMLPDKSGLELLQTVRENEKFAHLPVIMLTSLTEEVAFDKAKNLSIDGYLIKDKTMPGQLVSRIKLALKEHNLFS